MDDQPPSISIPTDTPPSPADSPAPPPDSASHWQQARALVRRLGPAGPLAIMASTLPAIGGFVLLGFVGAMAPWLRAHPVLGVVGYVSGFITLASLALLPTYACSILGGWTFGFGIGFSAALFSFCGASLLGYWINARAAGDRVVDIVREHPKWEAVRKALLESGFWRSLLIITLIRIPPTSPFAVTNFIMATTRAPLGAFLLGTAIGMAPRTGVVVWAAAHMSQLNFKDTGQTWLFIAGLVTTVAAVAIIGAIANRAVHQITRDHA